MKLYATLPPPQIKNLLLVGAGLIGGSLTLALKNAGVVQNVTGIGRRVEVMQHAVELGLIDRFVQPNTPEYAAAVASADVIVLAMPVGQTQAVLRDLLPHLAPHTIITDAGSTKQSVYDDARAVLGERIHQFVLAHPIAGREVNGPQAALADLYVNKKIMVCPLPQPAHNTPEQITTVVAMWQATGGLVYQMDLQAHDAIFAAVSHVPHVLAYALMNHVADSNLSDDKFAMAGAGFRDFTRIAASHPAIWTDVSFANQDSLLQLIDAQQQELQRLKDLILAGDAQALYAYYDQAQQQRDAWPPQPAQ